MKAISPDTHDRPLVGLSAYLALINEMAMRPRPIMTKEFPFMKWRIPNEVTVKVFVVDTEGRIDIEMIHRIRAAYEQEGWAISHHFSPMPKETVFVLKRQAGSTDA